MTGKKFPKRKKRVSTKTQSMQRVRTSPSSHGMITVQTGRAKLVLVIPRHHTGKQTECSAARGIQGVKCIVRFPIIVAYVFGEKRIEPEKHNAAEAGETRRLMLATKETTGEIFGATKTSENGNGCCRKVPKEVQELPFRPVDAKHHDGIRKMLVSFADM